MNQIQTVNIDTIRKSKTELFRQHDLVLSNKLTTNVLNSIPVPVLVLNKSRQMVFGNKAVLEMLDAPEQESILGKRFGELVGCPASAVGPTGCGSSPHCHSCGALKSIYNCIETGIGTEEVSMQTANSVMLHLKVNSELVNFGTEEFILLTLQDISTEKKKLLLERIFYHDILNSAHNIGGMAELISSDEITGSKDEYIAMLMKSTRELIDEINTHRLLTSSSQSEYLSQPVEINSFVFYKELKTEFEALADSGLIVTLDKRSENFNFTSDRVLLRRVIINMIKNAIEAESYLGKVTLGMIALKDKGAMLWVHNSAYMPDKVQNQVFNRSFSTKGNDRGLGTYSMKLLTEKFLKGKISFTSSPSNGTTFIIEIPDANVG